MSADEVRHPYILEPAEGILLTDSLIVYRDRTQAFLEDTCINPADLVTVPVVSIPLPVTSAIGGVRCRPQVSPEMMWFPLFWLPLHIGLRMYVHDGPGAVPRVETSEEWAVRIIFSITAAGLLDPDTGTWLDVLATVGLDSFDSETQRRVQRWQQGADDPDLDRIDLSPRFRISDEANADFINSARHFTHAQWALSAGEIKMAAAGIESMHLGEEDLRPAAEAWAFLALSAFSGGPELSSRGYAHDALGRTIRGFDSGEIPPTETLSQVHAIASSVYEVYGLALDNAALVSV